MAQDSGRRGRQDRGNAREDARNTRGRDPEISQLELREAINRAPPMAEPGRTRARSTPGYVPVPPLHPSTPTYDAIRAGTVFRRAPGPSEIETVLSITPPAFKWHFRHDCHFWPQTGYLEQRERKPLLRAICAECLRRADLE